MSAHTIDLTTTPDLILEDSPVKKRRMNTMSTSGPISRSKGSPSASAMDLTSEAHASNTPHANESTAAMSAQATASERPQNITPPSTPLKPFRLPNGEIVETPTYRKWLERQKARNSRFTRDEEETHRDGDIREEVESMTAFNEALSPNATARLMAMKPEVNCLSRAYLELMVDNERLWKEVESLKSTVRLLQNAVRNG